MSSDKKYIAPVERKTPPTWRLPDKLLPDGCRGLLFPSLRAQDGVDLVLFLANLTDDDQVEVVDLDGRLPRNQLSWP